jgi:hypothetical protein
MQNIVGLLVGRNIPAAAASAATTILNTASATAIALVFTACHSLVAAEIDNDEDEDHVDADDL